MEAWLLELRSRSAGGSIFLGNLNGHSFAAPFRRVDDDATIADRQRAALGETVRDLANLAATALALSQFVGQQPLSWRLVLAGFATWFALVWLGLWLVGEDAMANGLLIFFSIALGVAVIAFLD